MGTRERVNKLIEDEFLTESKFKDGDFIFYRFVGDYRGIFDDKNLKKFKKLLKEKFKTEYYYYEVEYSEDIYLVTNNDVFGFSLHMMHDRREGWKFDHVYLPKVESPCYIKIGDGFNYVFSPYYFDKDTKQEDITKLKPQKTLSSFW